MIARLSMIFTILALLAFACESRDSRGPEGEFVLDVLDVGQGDAMVLRFPSGAAWLVDGGGDPGGGDDVGERVVVPWLHRLGVRRLDRIVLSHAHPDHYEGLFAVLDAVPVDALVVPTLRHGGQRFGNLLELAERRGVRVDDLESGAALRSPDPAVDVLVLAAGGEDSDGEALEANDGSVVLRVSHGDRSLLLTGDVERAGESRLLDLGKLLDVDVVKAPHHLSKTSSGPVFVAATSPVLVVAGVGAENRYGFPHAGPMQRWIAAGADVRWTGRHRGLRVRTDGFSLVLEQEGPRRRLHEVRTWSPSAFVGATSTVGTGALVSQQGEKGPSGATVERSPKQRLQKEKARNRDEPRSKARRTRRPRSRTLDEPRATAAPRVRDAKSPRAERTKVVPPDDGALLNDAQWEKERRRRSKEAERRR